MISARPAIPESVSRVVRLLLPGLLSLLVAASPARAETPVPRDSGLAIDRVEVGFQGYYKVGEWTPLWVTLASDEAREVTIVVDAPDPDDNLTSLPGPSVALQPRVPTRVEATFRTGRLSGELQVRVQSSDDRTLAQKRLRPTNAANSEMRPALRLERPLWVTLGSVELSEKSPPAPATETAAAGLDTAREPRVAHFESLQALPADWQAMQSVEMLVFPTAAPASGASPLTSLSEANDALLRTWVERGGHLLLSIGSETAAFQKSSLARWVPIVVEGELAIRQLSTLEGYAGQYAPLKFTGGIKAAKLGPLPLTNVVVKHVSNPQALVASAPYGFGRVTVIAVDIDAPPLANWSALRPVLQKLAGDVERSQKRLSSKSNRQLTHVGVTDLATQLQQTSEDFPAVRRSSYWWVMGLILLYVVVIGPFDYFFVHRVLRRPELTWLTFPVLVGLAVAAAAWEAGRDNNRGLIINHFDVVDIDAATGARRGQAWVSLYSPEHRRFQVAVEAVDQFTSAKTAGATSAERRSSQKTDAAQLAWLASPENVVGGIYRSGAASLGGRSYRFAPFAAGVDNLPVAQWSTKSLSAVWHDEVPPSLVDCRLESFGAGQLRGTVTHHLDAPLEDCLLVVNGWAYIPTTADATLLPNVAWQPTGERNVRQRDLKALLTGEKQSRRNKEATYSNSDILTTTEAYNPLNRNRGQQVHMLSFHEAVGGSEYTGLANEALRDLEMTGLMRLGRGVLIGRRAAPAARVVVDGVEAPAPGAATWIRIVLPVLQK